MAKGDKELKLKKKGTSKKSKEDAAVAGKKTAAKSAPKKAGKKAKLKPVVFKPANEWKNFNFEIQFKTEKDGMLGGQIRVIRYAGQIKEDTPDNKKFDVASYDPMTVVAIAARLNGVLFHATGRPKGNGDPNRLSANTAFKAIGRASINKDGILKASIKTVSQLEKVEKNGKVKTKVVELDNKNVFARKIRKVNKYFAAAFVNAIIPPKPERKSRRKDADEE